jgi:hypothetical protein
MTLRASERVTAAVEMWKEDIEAGEERVGG